MILLHTRIIMYSSPLRERNSPIGPVLISWEQCLTSLRNMYVITIIMGERGKYKYSLIFSVSICIYGIS